MDRSEMHITRVRMLGEARALRAAFPDGGAMSALPVTALPAAPAGETEADRQCRSAIVYLRDEMLLVRAGKANDLTVLDDEIACVDRLRPGA